MCSVMCVEVPLFVVCCLLLVASGEEDLSLRYNEWVFIFLIDR